MYDECIAINKLGNTNGTHHTIHKLKACRVKWYYLCKPTNVKPLALLLKLMRRFVKV